MTRIMRNGDSGHDITIPAAGTKSDAFDARGDITYGVLIPAGFEGTGISFEVAPGPTDTFFPLALTPMAVEAGKAYTLPVELAPWPYFKIVSNSTEAADRALRIVAKA